MLCIKTNGNEIIPSADENTIANSNAATPIRKPSTANNIFIAISQANPSILQEKINPGNLMDRLEHQRKTSPIYEPDMMQYSMENIP